MKHTLPFTRASSGGAPRRLRVRGGFTLAELMVSVVVITVGVLALAGSSVGVLRQMRYGHQSALAAMVAQSRMENLRSRSCSAYANNSPTTVTTRGMTETYVINPNTITNPNSLRMAAVVETVTYVPRLGVTKKLGMVGWIPCV
jgi:prepilin-type N-terminal cleavage/methylation domain-containing protein